MHGFRREALLGEWTEFSGALLAFFALHSIPVRPAIKSRIVDLVGARPFTLIYSCISLLALGWLIVAASRAPYIELWSPAPWQNWVALVTMLAVCMIVAFALARPNPFSFGGAPGVRFDPERAGIVRPNRHPLLLAFFLWAAAHMLPNGDLAHVILFGLFAGFSLLGMKLINRRKQRQLGEMAYDDQLRAVRQTPVIGSFAQDRVMIRTIAGIGILVLLVVLHPAIIGVSPLAGLY